jgi:RNA polymerase sigma factor (sigma-70 family)
VDDERDLIARCARHDERAWAALVREYEPRVEPADDADDVRQEVWARLLAGDAAALRRMRGAAPRTLRAFLARVARSVTVDQLRSRGARPPGSGGEKPESLADQAPTPERAFDVEEQHRRFGAALEEAVRRAERPGRDGDILRLHFEDGLSAAEISALGVGLEPRGVEAVLRRAKSRIEALLRHGERP